MNVINLTPHSVVLYAPDTPDVVEDPGTGVVATWDVAGPAARCAEIRRDEGAITLYARDGNPIRVPLTGVAFGEVSDLPAPRDGVVYIVSRATALRATGRTDVFYPDRTVRSVTGQVVGCRALARVADG